MGFLLLAENKAITKDLAFKACVLPLGQEVTTSLGASLRAFISDSERKATGRHLLLLLLVTEQVLTQTHVFLSAGIHNGENEWSRIAALHEERSAVTDHESSQVG